MALPYGLSNRSDTWSIDPQNTQVGAAVSGRRQIVASAADRWTAEITFRMSRAKLREFRAWVTKRRGMLIPDDVGPVQDWGGYPIGGGVTFSDGATFSDGSGFAIAPTVSVAKAIGATTLDIESYASGDAWFVGAFFSVGGRLYQVTNVRTSSTNSAVIDFWPPLRSAAAAGDAMSYPPTTTMRLATDTTGSISDSWDGLYEATLQLEEVL
jgi:hypothetical protein